MPHSELVQSLLRGLDILKLISSKPEGMRLNEIVEATGLNKSTIHNLLRTMAAREFVVKDALNRFTIGPAVVEMGDSVKKNDIQQKLKTELLKVAVSFPDHVVTVSTLKGNRIKCIMRVSPDFPDMVQTPAEQFFMPYISVTAIALQAANHDLGAVLERNYPFEEFGIGKWGSEKKFRALKEQVLKDGYCCQFLQGKTAAAFILPGAMALGFSTAGTTPGMLAKYQSAADELRRAVWEK